MDTNQMNQAEIYNKTKAIVFSLYHKDGIESALEYIEKCSNSSLLCPQSRTGLTAEIRFYHRYKKELTLDPVWDYGVHCDFVGNIDGCNNCRMDVTTNLDFKTEEALFNIQTDTGRVYKYIKVDSNSGEILSVVDYVNSSLEKAHNRYNLAVFMPGERDKFNPYINIYSINLEKLYDDVTLIGTLTDYYVPDLHSIISEIPDDFEHYEEVYEIDNHLVRTAKLIMEKYKIRIDAIGQHVSRDYDEDEHYIKVYWRHPALQGFIDDRYEDDLMNVY